MIQVKENKVTEDIAGFRVVWVVKDYMAEVRVWEIVGWTEGDHTKPVFRDYDEDGVGVFVDSIEETKEYYLEGTVKWDGCSEFEMKDQHLCGVGDYKKHMALLEYVWKRAFELMGREPEEAWGETYYLQGMES